MQERLFWRTTLAAMAPIAGVMAVSAAEQQPVDAAQQQVVEAGHIGRCDTTPEPGAAPLQPPKPPVFETPPAGASEQTWNTLLAQEQAEENAFVAASKAYQDALLPPVLKIPVVDGIAEGNPVVPSDSVINSTTKALVEVTASDWKGTGFITTDAEGKQVVITAGHVVGPEQPHQLTITTSKGVHVQPTGGCYIYETNGKFKSIESIKDSDAGPDADIAVLTLPHELTDAPLTIASTEPTAGEWVDYVNYQEDNGPRHSKFPDDDTVGPATYTGVVTPPEYESIDMTVITGAESLGKDPTNNEFTFYHAEPGASGGPVENSFGQVVGESIDGTKNNLYLDNGTLSNLFSIEFTGVNIGQETGFEPTMSTVAPEQLIEEALDSPALK